MNVNAIIHTDELIKNYSLKNARDIKNGRYAQKSEYKDSIERARDSNRRIIKLRKIQQKS